MDEETELGRFLASAVVAAESDGRLAVRVVELVVVDRADAEVVREVVVVFLSVTDPATLDRRSAEETAGLVGVLEDGVPASDMRLAALEMLFLSSPELRTPLELFSSAELTEAFERWVAVVEADEPGRRVVVAGLVGGLFSVLPPVAVLLADVAVEVLLVAVVLVGVRLAAVVEDAGFLAGEAEFSLPVSGLVMTSDLVSSPERIVESTGVSGGASSTASGAGATGSSVEAMVTARSCHYGCDTANWTRGMLEMVTISKLGARGQDKCRMARGKNSSGRRMLASLPEPRRMAALGTKAINGSKFRSCAA